MKTPQKSKFSALLEKGIFYSPANKHYDNKGVVDCDRCKRKNIKMCIGDNKNDICMSCIHDIERQLAPESGNESDSDSSESDVKPRLTKMKHTSYVSESESESDVEPKKTKMVQKAYTSSTKSTKPKYGGTRKKMKHSSFRKKTKTKTKSKPKPKTTLKSKTKTKSKTDTKAKPKPKPIKKAAMKNSAYKKKKTKTKGSK